VIRNRLGGFGRGRARIVGRNLEGARTTKTESFESSTASLTPLAHFVQSGTKTPNAKRSCPANRSAWLGHWNPSNVLKPRSGRGRARTDFPVDCREVAATGETGLRRWSEFPGVRWTRREPSEKPPNATPNAVSLRDGERTSPEPTPRGIPVGHPPHSAPASEHIQLRSRTQGLNESVEFVGLRGMRTCRCHE